MALEIRPVVDDEFAVFTRTLAQAFADSADDDAEVAYWRSLLPPERTLAAFDGADLVATSGAFAFELPLGQERFLPAAGLTFVSVRATHRRRGLLRTLMARLLREALERGEPLAVLTASEAGIYGRFGFGVAALAQRVAIDSRADDFRFPAATGGRVRITGRDGWRPVAPAAFDPVQRATPGDVPRTAAWWDAEARDEAWLRAGRGPLLTAIHESADGVTDGFVSWRAESSWSDGISRHIIHVEDLVGRDPDVEAALLRLLLDIDLVGEVRLVRPVDDPLRWRLEDLRRWRSVALLDANWLSLLDVAAALSARRYAEDGQLGIEVTDRFLDRGGCYTLEVESGGMTAECRRSAREPDLTMDIRELGSIYLGGLRAGDLAAAGLVHEHRPGALARADRLFATPVRPFLRTQY